MDNDQLQGQIEGLARYLEEKGITFSSVEYISRATGGTFAEGLTFMKSDKVLGTVDYNIDTGRIRKGENDYSKLLKDPEFNERVLRPLQSILYGVKGDFWDERLSPIHKWDD